MILITLKVRWPTTFLERERSALPKLTTLAGTLIDVWSDHPRLAPQPERRR